MDHSKILVVEDDGIIGRHIQISLQKLGYEAVGLFIDGEEAVEAMRAATPETAPDLVLMDISLHSEMDGIEAARLIHELRDIPVIYLTAYSASALLERAKITDPFGYLVKPFDEHNLHATIEMALQKHKLEKRLRESEAFNRAIIDNSPLGISVRDRNGRLLEYNPAWKRIWAMPDDELHEDAARERQGLAFDQRDDYLSDWQEQVRRVYEQGGSLFLPELKTTGRRPGVALWLSQYFYALQSPEGQVERVVVLTEDISARKAAEERVQRESARAQQYLEIADVILEVLNTRGEVVLLNPKGCQTLGYTAEEIVGKNWLETCVPEEERAGLAAGLEQLMQGQGGEDFEYHENPILTRSGERRWIAWHNARIFDENGAIAGVISSGEDITEQRLAEQKLRASEARYRSLFENSPISMWQEDFSGVRLTLDELKRQGITDFGEYFDSHPEAVGDCMAKVRATDVNQATLRLMKAESKEQLFNSLGQILVPETFGLFRDELIAIAGGALSFEGEGVNRDLNGGRLDIRLHWSAAPGAEVDLSRVIVSVSDITAQKQRERELLSVSSVSSALRCAETRSEMLPILLNQLLSLFQADGALIAMLDANTGDGLVELAEGDWVDWSGFHIPLGMGITGQILATGQPYLTNDAINDPFLLDKARESLDLHAIMGVPLIAHGQTIGNLMLGRHSDLGEADLRLLTAIADMAANALYRASLHESTHRHAEQMATVGAIGRALAETLDLKEIYERLARAVLELLPDTATVLISAFDMRKETLECVFGSQDGETLNVSEFPVIQLAPPGQGTQSQVIHTRQPLIIQDRLDSRGSNPTIFGTPGPSTVSALYVPLLAKGKVLGVIQAQSYKPGRYTPAEAELLALVANSAAITIENASLLTETRRQLERLSAMHAIDSAIASSFDVHLTLNILLDQIVAQLNVDTANILMLNSLTQTLEFACGRGYLSQVISHSHYRLGEGLAGRAALERRLIMVDDLSRTHPELSAGFPLGALDERFLNTLKSNGFTAYLAAPLIAKGQVKGILEVFNRQPLQTDNDWQGFLETLTGQAAIAVDNAALFDDLQRTNMELAMAYDTTLEGWIRALDLRDKETEGHTLRVTELAEQLAAEIGLSEMEMMHIRRGALLHDIGKIGVQDHILRKAGPLTDEEWVIMRRHPQFAYDLLSPIAYLQQDLDIPYCHHEKWDGSGYPRGLKGQQIPLPARLFAIIDVWDALISERPYRDAWPEDKAFEFVRSQAGIHFDPDIVQAFFRLMGKSA